MDASWSDAWVRLTLRRSRGILLYACSVLLLGLWLLGGVPVEWTPTLHTSRVMITAAWPGASPLAVERHVTAPIERAVEGLPGTERVASLSREGRGFVRLDVAPGRDLAVYLAELSDHLAAVRGSLPDFVFPAITQEVSAALADEQGFMVLQLLGRGSPESLRRLAEEVVAPRLRNVPGVALVTVEGGEERELLVSLDDERLRAYHLSAGQVRLKLAEAFASRSYGWLREIDGQRLVLSLGEESLDGIRRLALTAGPTGSMVRLGDVARVTLGPAPVRTISRVDGKPVVTILLDRAPQSHMLGLAGLVREKMASLRGILPAHVELLAADDRSLETRRRLRDLSLRGGLGLLVILFTLRVLLGSARAVGIVVFTAFVSILSALAFLEPAGLSLNVVTLAGLLAIAGVLLANAVVVQERLLAHRSRRGAPGGYRRAAAAALREASLPQLAGTAATLSVLALLVASGGEIREIFTTLGVLAALTCAFSLLNAALLVPVLGQRLPAGRARSRRSLLDAGLLLPCRFAARHPKTVLLLLLAVIGFPIALFLEEVEIGRTWSFEGRPELNVRLNLPAGSGIERADALIRGFERQALGSPSVLRTIAQAGEDISTLRVLFHEEAMTSDEPLAVRQRLIAHAVQLSGLEVGVSGLLPMGYFSGFGEVSQLTVDAFGPSYEGLQAFAAGFAGRLAAYPGVSSVDIDASPYGRIPGRETLRLHWGTDAVARTGLTAEDMAAALRGRLYTRSPDLYAALAGSPRVPVRLLSASAKDQDLDGLLARPFPGRGDGTIQLGTLAVTSAQKEPGAIERENQQYKRHIQMFYRGSEELGDQILDREVGAARIPPGYRLERPGKDLLSREVGKDLPWLIAGSLGVVCLVLAAVLESSRLALVVLACLPLAWSGISLGFVTTGESFAEGALLGYVLTIAVATNTGVLLADRYRRLRQNRSGTPRPLLAVLAVRGRLHPVWAATLTAIAGVAPLLILPKGEEIWTGFALTVVGGLLSFTVLAPVAMVALLSASTPAAARRRSA